MAPALPEDRFVDANGVRIHVVDWGGDGPPAVFCHGTGLHARLWSPIAAALSPRFRPLALDARGHGDSDKPPSGYDWSVLIADVLHAMDALGVRGAIGVGHSLGATTLAAAAAERPDVFERVVLVDMILFPRELRGLHEGENPVAAKARKRRARWPSRQAILESYAPREPFRTWREDVLALYVEHGTEPDDEGGVRLKCPPRIEAQVFGMSSGFDGWAVLERLDVPALLVRGGDSRIFSATDAAQALERLRRGRLVTVPATTHFVPMEDPDRVRALVEEFAAESRALPIASRGLAHLALVVKDLERMRAFYEDVFGMRVVWQPDADNVYLSSGRDNLALHRTADGPPGRGALDHLGFLVASPAAVHAAEDALAARGVALLRPARTHRDGSCSLYLEDPDGNVVQVLYTPDARV